MNLYKKLMQATTINQAEAAAKLLTESFKTPSDAAEYLHISNVSELLPPDVAFNAPLAKSDHGNNFRETIARILVRKWRNAYIQRETATAKTLAETHLSQALHIAGINTNTASHDARRELQRAYASPEQIQAALSELIFRRPT